MSKPTYFVQITSYFANDPWHTVLMVHDRSIAESAADGLKLSSAEAPGGLRGARDARVMTLTDIRRECGFPGVERAFDEQQWNPAYEDEVDLARSIAFA